MILMLGKRQGGERHYAPHNLPFAVLGAGMLWFGWFGFNAGSSGAAGGLAVSAFVNTNTAAAAAGVTWMILDWTLNEVPTMLGVATGIVAGLVAVTPAAGYVTPLSALAIGALSGVVCFFFVTKVKARFGYDDSLDVFGVHGVGGIVGALATGLFATKAINPAGNDGLFYGNAHQLWVQFLTTAVAVGYSAVMTFVLYKIVDRIVGMRVEQREENIGLDLTQHGETGYTLHE